MCGGLDWLRRQELVRPEFEKSGALLAQAEGDDAGSTMFIRAKRGSAHESSM